MAYVSLHIGYVRARRIRAGGSEYAEYLEGAPGRMPPRERPGGRLAPVHDRNGRAASGWSRLRPAITSLGRTGVASKERELSPLDVSRRTVTICRARSSRPPAARPCTSIYTERSFVGKTPHGLVCGCRRGPFSLAAGSVILLTLWHVEPPYREPGIQRSAYIATRSTPLLAQPG